MPTALPSRCSPPSWLWPSCRSPRLRPPRVGLCIRCPDQSADLIYRGRKGRLARLRHRFFFFKQKTAYDLGLGIPAEPLFRSHPFTSDVRDEFVSVTEKLMD